MLEVLALCCLLIVLSTDYEFFKILDLKEKVSIIIKSSILGLIVLFLIGSAIEFLPVNNHLEVAASSDDMKNGFFSIISSFTYALYFIIPYTTMFFILTNKEYEVKLKRKIDE